MRQMVSDTICLIFRGGSLNRNELLRYIVGCKQAGAVVSPAAS